MKVIRAIDRAVSDFLHNSDCAIHRVWLVLFTASLLGVCIAR